MTKCMLTLLSSELGSSVFPSEQLSPVPLYFSFSLYVSFETRFLSSFSNQHQAWGYQTNISLCPQNRGAKLLVHSTVAFTDLPSHMLCIWKWILLSFVLVNTTNYITLGPSNQVIWTYKMQMLFLDCVKGNQAVLIHKIQHIFFLPDRREWTILDNSIKEYWMECFELARRGIAIHHQRS